CCSNYSLCSFIDTVFRGIYTGLRRGLLWKSGTSSPTRNGISTLRYTLWIPKYNDDDQSRRKAHL
ncbi:Hypothetical predicted protein, partial [Paramuricea clavata]